MSSITPPPQNDAPLLSVEEVLSNIRKAAAAIPGVDPALVRIVADGLFAVSPAADAVETVSASVITLAEQVSSPSDKQ